MTARRRIFLAHAREDKARVRKLYADLQAEGFDPWLDEEDLLPGQNWRTVIPGVIREAAVFVACLSSRSVGKQGFVYTEFRTALTAYGERPPDAVYIIPVKLDDCEVPDLQVPNQGISLRDLHWVELPQEGGFRRLVRGLRHGLGEGPDDRQQPVPQPAELPDSGDAADGQPAAPRRRRQRPTRRPGRGKAAQEQQAVPQRESGPAGEAAALLAELERPETTHQRRAEIGRRLDELGDPRPGVGVDADGTPQIDWCRVPGGEVAIEFTKGNLRRKKLETFHIARFPVTVAQYRAFLNAEDGWRNPAWWADDLKRDRKGRSQGFGDFGNHPVVRVNWFDAMAFCRWLSRRLGFPVRLPDDWEWQQAATGGDAGNAFPWGPAWDPKRQPHLANTGESRLDRPTAVGMYPAGATPQGVLDMAGTVWESGLNKYYEPEVTDSTVNDTDPRVLRGGSWFNFQDGARCAGRGGCNPDYRYTDLGFRVLCSSPIVDH